MAKFMSSEYNFRGKIEAQNLAIGTDARAVYAADNSRTVAELQSTIDALIAAFAQHRAVLMDPAGLIQDARAVRTEIASPKPNHGKIVGLLSRMAGGVAGITALAAAMENLQHAVGRLF